MQRKWKIATGSLIGVVALLLLLGVLLTLFNWNSVKPWINHRVSDAAGRPFAINGDLSLSWERPARPLSGWRNWIPWPHLRARDITMANPEWATSGPTMARIEQLDFSIDLLPLLHKTIRIEPLVLTEPQLVLEQSEDGRDNWTFNKKDQESHSSWTLDLRDVSITRGTVRLVLQAKKADVTARIDTITDGKNAGGLKWSLEGELNGDKVSGGGSAGSLLSLRSPNTDYPVAAELKVGQTKITADGKLTDPVHLKGLDINLKILGASMAQLFPLSGIVLPETPHFSTEGRVIGKIDPGAMQLRYEDFTGKVGSSDIGGTLEYLQKDPRPLLRGKVSSNYLNFKDLGALVGADSPEAQKKRGATDKQPPGKVLPVQTFKTERWDRIDVQVEFAGKKIVRSENLPFENLTANISLNDGVLGLNPLNFGIAGGRLTSELRVDGNANPTTAQLQMAASGLKLRKLFPDIKEMHASLGELNGNAKLSSQGESVASLLGNANGELRALISRGSISKFILEAMGLNIGSAVIAKLFGDHQVEMNCMASDFKITDGLMQTQVFVVDTTDATIRVDGSIDFAKEALDLTIHPDTKGVRLISLRTPLYVRGTFKKPDLGVDKGVIALKAGAAAVLGTVAAPVAGLLALINPGPDEDSPCGALLAQAKQPPKAPPPEDKKQVSAKDGKAAARATAKE